MVGPRIIAGGTSHESSEDKSKLNGLQTVFELCPNVDFTGVQLNDKRAPLLRKKVTTELRFEAPPTMEV